MDRSDVGKWIGPCCLAGALVFAGCGLPAAAPRAAHSPLGVLVGTAGECSGPAGRPAHPVQVIVYRGSHVVVEQARLGNHAFRFSLPSGNYRVTTDQSYVTPVHVVLHPGTVAHAGVVSSSCD
jgi:hypothetical protein